MINLNAPPGAKILELGGGANRHPQATVNVDVRKVDGVDFVVDFNAASWPEISSEEFDVAISVFCLEHISWRNTPNFLKETFRVLKPGGRVFFIVPNTEAQIKWILERGWEKNEKNDGSFVESSRILFGDLDYPENSHRCYLSPSVATKLFQEAGFENTLIQPFGAIATDMVVEAIRPSPTPPPNAPDASRGILGGLFTQGVPEPPVAPPLPVQLEPEVPLTQRYGRVYWENYQGGGPVWDYPHHEIIARKVREKHPNSVLELGCGRGYVLKRIQDHNVRVEGIDVSRYAWMTRVLDPVVVHDLLTTPWPVGKGEFDLVFSNGLLEHLPERKIQEFMYELSRVGKRGLHGVTFEGEETSHDPARRTLRSKSFWQKALPEGHELFAISELQAGELPADYLRGDGKVKLNLGSNFTMFHQGWLNLDSTDASNFSQAFKYPFSQQDVTQGLPYGTGVVDLIFLSRLLNHLNSEEGLRLLVECRRILRPEGALRLLVPDLGLISKKYLEGNLSEFDEVEEGCSRASSQSSKFWALLFEGQRAAYDWNSLQGVLQEACFTPVLSSFRANPKRHPGTAQILRETLEGSSMGCLVVDAYPLLG